MNNVKKRTYSRAERLIKLLEKGPWFSRDLENAFKVDHFELRVIIDKANGLLKGSDRFIKMSKGNNETGIVYAIRHKEAIDG